MNIVKELTNKLVNSNIEITERTVNKIITMYIRTKKQALLSGDTVIEEGLLTVKPHFRFNNTFAGQVTPNLTFECKMNEDFKKELGKVFCTNPKVRDTILGTRKSEIDNDDRILKYMGEKYGVKPSK